MEPQDSRLYKTEGLQTVDTLMEKLSLTRQSAINLISKWRKAQHLTVWARGKGPRIYKITIRKQLPRAPGMFDIINKYSPHMKLNPWYDHQVHGPYGPEEALIDAIETKSFRAILASLHLFKHIKDWKKLYRLANEKGIWQKVGALYDVARKYLKVRKMPEKYHKAKAVQWVQLTQLKKKNFPVIAESWKVYISFNEKDMAEIA